MASPSQQTVAQLTGGQDPFDAAAQSFGQTSANSRFTKTPITILNMQQMANQMNAKMKGVTSYVDRPQKTSTGSYLPEDGGQSTVQLAPDAGWKDLQNVLHHEDIHALLLQAGYAGKALPESLNNRLLPQGDTWWKRLFDVNAPTSVTAWNGSNRAGNYHNEMPAYMGAFKQGQIKGVSPDQAQSWTSAFMDSLPPQVKEKLTRLLASYQASQQFGSKPQ